MEKYQKQEKQIRIIIINKCNILRDVFEML